MADIRHRVGITAPKAQVYEALATVEGLSGWWTGTPPGTARSGPSWSSTSARPSRARSWR